MRYKLTITIGISLLGAALVLAAWPSSKEPTPDPQTRTVTVAPVTLLETGRTLRLPGVTRAAQRAKLSFTVPARLVGRPVELGDQVRSGQILAKLDDRQLRNAVRAAEAATAELDVRLAQAGRDQARVQQLVAVQAATTEELEKVTSLAAALTAAREAAEAELQDARQMLDETWLRAPFAGTVTAVLSEPGEWVSPGRPVIELVGSGPVELEVEVPESVVSGLTVGRPVQVELPFADRRQVSGRLQSVSRVANGPGRLFPVVVALPGKTTVAAGMTAELLLEVHTSAELAVPVQAVLNPGSTSPSLFCARHDRAEEIPVELGRLHGDLVVVRGRLEPGDPVVVNGHTALSDGDSVEVS
jgi:RND family efflux transporter MFP subunit